MAHAPRRTVSSFRGFLLMAVLTSPLRSMFVRCLLPYDWPFLMWTMAMASRSGSITLSCLGCRTVSSGNMSLPFALQGGARPFVALGAARSVAWAVDFGVLLYCVSGCSSLALKLVAGCSSLPVLLMAAECLKGLVWHSHAASACIAWPTAQWSFPVADGDRHGNAIRLRARFAPSVESAWPGSAWLSDQPSTLRRRDCATHKWRPRSQVAFGAGI